MREIVRKQLDRDKRAWEGVDEILSSFSLLTLFVFSLFSCSSSVHCWNYRRDVALIANIPAQDEFDYTTYLSQPFIHIYIHAMNSEERERG